MSNNVCLVIYSFQVCVNKNFITAVIRYSTKNFSIYSTNFFTESIKREKKTEARHYNNKCDNNSNNISNSDKINSKIDNKIVMIT